MFMEIIMQANENFREKPGRRWSLDTISSKIILAGFIIAIIVIVSIIVIKKNVIDPVL